MGRSGIRWGRGAIHAGALLATAWSLIATSAPDAPLYPARDCFLDVPSPSSLVVTLLSAVPTDAGDLVSGIDAAEVDATDIDAGAPGADASPGRSDALPSCGGIDGLAPGVALQFDVTQANRPEAYQQVCFGFQTTRIEPLPDVSLSTPPSPLGDTFTSAAGAYLSSDLKGCTGEWSVYVEPPEPVGAEQLTSPFTSAPGSWRLVRTIGMPQAQFCGAFASRGAASCQDTFLVDINLRGDP
jgi:hypothetical protein